MQVLYQVIKTDAHFSSYEVDACFSYYIYVKKYDILFVKPVKILNLNFSKKKGAKTVIYRNSPEKSWDFSRSRMTKQIAPLESSREI